jgi:hypothetical protein
VQFLEKDASLTEPVSINLVVMSLHGLLCALCVIVLLYVTGGQEPAESLAQDLQPKRGKLCAFDIMSIISLLSYTACLKNIFGVRCELKYTV